MSKEQKMQKLQARIEGGRGSLRRDGQQEVNFCTLLLKRAVTHNRREIRMN